ncbi:MAG: integrase arm-type DNA-binding domain-containing protein [Proteobacteria bacterium]|nr:integrase arm-type DNA-binding domain-containing protein [Pseudomonadota bacterium]
MYAVGGVAGLQLVVKSMTARSWILRVVIGDKRRDIGLGGYPDVTLEQARTLAREARLQIRKGIDPVEARRAAQDALRSANAKRMTFDQAAAACHKTKSREFRNPKHSAQWISSLTTYASPIIGSIDIARIELAHIVAVLEPIWDSKTETASRLRGRIESTISWATVSGYRSGENPARWRGNLDQVLPKPSKIRKVKHHAALPWQELPAFMANLRERTGMATRALEFAILTAARSGEVRYATWNEIDLDAKLWTVPAERMKAARIHRVPLPGPAIQLLNALPRFEGSPNVFPAVRGGSLSDAALSAVTRRMNVDAVPHGFRSTFKDWCRNSTGYADEVSELALAHVSGDATRAAYARDELLQKRARLMRAWAKFCGPPASMKSSVSTIRGKHGATR